MGSDARVLVVAKTDDLVGPLCQGLDALGWRTLTARSVVAARVALADLVLEAAIIDAAHPDFETLAQTLRDTAAPRRLPVIAIGPAPARTGSP